MLPREVVIGAAALLLQCIYSTVYPQLAHHAQYSFAPLFESAKEAVKDLVDLVDLSGLYDQQEIPKSEPSEHKHRKERKGTQSQAGSKKASGKREVRLDEAMAEIMQPQIMEFVSQFKHGEEISTIINEDVDISWDVHRITDAVVPWAYYYRVRVRNKSSRPCAFRGAARFYVLKLPDGRVFPIHRVTEGPAGFTLEQGEEYLYSFIFFNDDKVLEAKLGFLFAKGSSSGERSPEEFVNASSAILQPHKARSTTMEQLQELNEGRFFQGAIDLRGVSYL